MEHVLWTAVQSDQLMLEFKGTEADRTLSGDAWPHISLALASLAPPDLFVFSEEILVGALELAEAERVVVGRPGDPHAPVRVLSIVQYFILSTPVH